MHFTSPICRPCFYDASCCNTPNLCHFTAKVDRAGPPSEAFTVVSAKAVLAVRETCSLNSASRSTAQALDLYQVILVASGSTSPPPHFSYDRTKHGLADTATGQQARLRLCHIEPEGRPEAIPLSRLRCTSALTTPGKSEQTGCQKLPVLQPVPPAGTLPDPPEQASPLEKDPPEQDPLLQDTCTPTREKQGSHCVKSLSS